MADVKWIKLTTDMFDNSKIKQLRRLPEGNNVVLIWVMLLTMAGKCNAGGMIILTENIPYTPEMLADELGFELTTVTMALQTLNKFNMITSYNDCLTISNWNEYQNVDGMEKIKIQNKERQQKHRDKKKQLKIEENNNVTHNVTHNVTVTQSSYSYSISNSFNTSIYYELLNSNKYEYITGNDYLNSEIVAWLEYKESLGKKKGGYTERGLNTLLNQIIGYDKEYGTDKVAAVIDDSISNKYLGICWDKINKIKVFKQESDIQKENKIQEETVDYGWDD